MPLVESTVRAGAAGDGAFCLRGVFYIFHRRRSFSAGTQERVICGGGHVQLVCRQRDEGYTQGEFL
jgi:hypothetical protein